MRVSLTIIGGTIYIIPLHTTCTANNAQIMPMAAAAKARIFKTHFITSIGCRHGQTQPKLRGLYRYSMMMLSADIAYAFEIIEELIEESAHYNAWIHEHGYFTFIEDMPSSLRYFALACFCSSLLLRLITVFSSPHGKQRLDSCLFHNISLFTMRCPFSSRLFLRAVHRPCVLHTTAVLSL